MHDVRGLFTQNRQVRPERRGEERYSRVGVLAATDDDDDEEKERAICSST